jgi:hypothetical protein
MLTWLQTISTCVGLEVPTEVAMKNAVFWDVAQCALIINRRFGGKYRGIFRVEEITLARESVREDSPVTSVHSGLQSV